MLVFFLIGVVLVFVVFHYVNSKYYTGEVSDHFNGKYFFNPGKPMDKGFLSFLKWQFTGEKGVWPRHVENAFKATPPAQVRGEELLVTYVGHATVLIQTQGLNILTDPVWSDRASPFSWIGPKRVHAPGVSWSDLPKIDIVLVSHNHYEHLDLNTLEKLWTRDKPRIITPLGNDTIIHKRHKDIKVEVYDWDDQISLKEGVILHLDPMHHWSARGVLDQNKALWAAFTLQTPAGNIYFVGDSGYGKGEDFKRARAKHGDYRFAILPMGAYAPRWFMAYGHMNPEEAVKAYEDLGKPYTLPSHYDVFHLADEGYGDALKALEAGREKNPAEKFKPLQVGQMWQIPLK